MSQKGGSMRLPNGLTVKQNAFKDKMVTDIIKGKNPNGTQAVLKIYDTKDPITAGAIAGENLKHPLIKKTIQEELEANGLSRNKLLENLAPYASGEIDPGEKLSIKHKINVNLSLLKLIDGGKTDSRPNQSITFINLGFSEAKKELEKMNSETQDFIDDED